MPATVDHVVHALESELAAARELIVLLKTEEAHLIAADTDKLSGVVEQKSALLARMAELGSQRMAAFDAHHIGTTAAAIESGLAGLGKNALSAWVSLVAAATEGRELNRTNGLLIARQMSSSQNALQILQANANSGRLYGPNGQSSAGTIGRTFIAG